MDLPGSWVEERGRCRILRLDRKDTDRRRSDMAIDSETKERSSRRRWMHFESAARQLTLDLLAIDVFFAQHPKQ